MSPPDPKPQPVREDPAVTRAKAEEAARRRSGRGYRSTVISDLVSQFGGGSGAKATFGE